MKKRMRFCSAIGIAVFPVILISAAYGSGPIVIEEARHDVSARWSQMAVHATPVAGPDREMREPREAGTAIMGSQPDPVAQATEGPLSGVTTLLNFDGQSANDNRNILGFAYVPPDTNGAVGDTQFVQMVNVTIAVYDKSTGAIEMGPALIHTIWTGFGGPCENAGDGGDPVVLYDQIAGRWLVSQLQYNFLLTRNEQCVAISTTSDATGSYNRYDFPFGQNFPDYPKFGVWPDAYYNSINVYGPNSFNGAEACALDRTAMLNGTKAKAICFQQPPTVFSLVPANLDGSTLPPTGEANFFINIADSSHLNLFQFHVDFTHPSNSSFTGPAPIPVAPFSEICGNKIGCIPQPKHGENLDSLGHRLMYRLAYRNFGDHESLVINHTVAGGPLAGVRWYEIRSPEASPSVFQQGTVINSTVNYWMGSIAIDHAGDIALGFSASSTTQDPSVWFVGRRPTDGRGKMQGPISIVDGTGVQRKSFHRWGDYSSMAIDPSDDCTFWYTQEYYAVTGSFNWSTRIGAFKFDNCK